MRLASLTTVTAVVAALVFVFAGASSATVGGTFPWNTVNGANACAPDTTGTMLWIFNPHSAAVPTDLTITWNISGGGTVTNTYTGWTNPGNGQNWHLTVDIPVDAVLPPASATLDYTGTLGSNPILTISGCNEGGGGTPPAAAPTVSKTAGQNANTEYSWVITKGVDKPEIDTTPGGTATFHYTVTLTGTGGTPTIGDVTGTITVFNNAGGDITLSGISDQLSDGTVCTVDTTVDPSYPDLVIPANGSQDFPYSCSLSAYPTDAPNTTNTATITWNAQTLSDNTLLAAGSADTDPVPVDFTTSVTDNCATATDTFNGGTPDPLGTYCADTGLADTSLVTLPGFAESYTAPTWTLTYPRTVNAPALGSCVEYDNRADWVDNSTPQKGDHADASATVCTFNAPLTIGYWWNHLANSAHSGSFTDSNCAHLVTGSCSKNGPWTKQFLPQPLGGAYSVDTILKAASVFAANNCSSSSSQNAIGCLAAQLLGAELNRANISNSCIDPVIATANTFLTNPPATSVTYGGYTANSINYVGPTGNYSGISSTQRNLALALKNTLVNYNQGGGC